MPASHLKSGYCLPAAKLQRQITGEVIKPHSSGFSMVEFVVALSIFSAVAGAMLATQITGKRVHYDAMQRSLAVEMASEMLSRIQSNALAADAYLVEGLGDPNQPLSEPAVNCRSRVCAASELASYDLWRWQQDLQGSSAQRLGVHVGGLLAPRACIRERDGLVSVTVVWKGLVDSVAGSNSDCGADAAGVYDAPAASPSNNLHRRQIVLSSLLVGAPG